MNTYQKVLVCIIRIVAVAQMLWALGGLGVAWFVARAMWKISLIGAVPLLLCGFLLFLLSVPLARLITIGIREG